MSITSLVVGTIVSQILFIITKIVFINYLNLDSSIVFWLLFIFLTVETIAVVRRMGVLNLFESLFVSVIWLIISLLVDIVITTTFTGRDVYSHLYFWATYLLIILAVMVFHKKVHVQARKERAK